MFDLNTPKLMLVMNITGALGCIRRVSWLTKPSCRLYHWNAAPCFCFLWFFRVCRGFRCGSRGCHT